MSDDWEDMGYTSGFDVFVPEGRLTQVLGPDGEPVRYLQRHQVGFDLRPRASKKSREALAQSSAIHAAALKRLADR